MRSLRRDPALWIVVVLVLVSFFGANYAEGHEKFSPATIFPSLETAVSITALAIAFFATWAWKWPIFRGWLVVVPNLNGCWVGTIAPMSAVNGGKIYAVANIRQTLFRVAIRVWTKKLKSASYAAEVYCDDDSGEQRLVYSYEADPYLANRDTNPAHDGGAKLAVTANARRLVGKYWTDRLTRGEIALCRHSQYESRDPERLLESLLESRENKSGD